jgi:uncharacterized protein YndB with AHSA1/START domain
MTDIVAQLNQAHREVTGRSVVVRREFDTPIEDVWSACTDAERISRWFLPVSGDLRLGGRYQLEGNAGGEILLCEPPRLLRVSWEFGDMPASAVEVRLTPAGSGSVFELEHAGIVEQAMWAQFGPGAVGVGWDGALLGLAIHLSGESWEKPDDWERSPAAVDFMTRSAQAWGVAHEKSGATSDEVAEGVRNTITAYVGPH